MSEKILFPKNDYVNNHDEQFPKRGIDLEFEKFVSEKEISTLQAISATARLITRMEPLSILDFESITDEYIDLRINNKEFDKALYYSYTVLVDCLKDAGNPEKMKRKNKILDYMTLCIEAMRDGKLK